MGARPDEWRLWRRVWAWRVGSSAFTSVTRIGYFLIWIVPSGALAIHITPAERTKVALTSIAVAAVVTPVGRWHARRQFQPVVDWLRSDRPATPEDQAALLDQPRRHAGAIVLYWAGGGVLAGLIYLFVYRGQLVGAAAMVLGLTLLGLHSAAFVYLGVERLLRPVAAQALVRSQPLRLTLLSVRNRFLLAFILGPGVTIAGIAVFLSLRRSHMVDIGSAIWPVAVLGLIDGLLLVAMAAESVTRPMAEVRVAMKRVLDGDLDAEVGVDASSEVGLLQVGFNRMLAGLRERERLRDLLGQYAGADVARVLLERGADFAGTELDATVLMVDLIGSTPFTEAMPSAEVVATLNLLFEATIHVVGEEGGWVNRFVGDAAVCVFGAPVPLDDHADRALRAARALQAKVASLREDRPWLDAAIGVSSGTLLAANVGSSARHEFAVVGDAANEAARLTDEAKRRPGRLLASSATLDRADAEAGWWGPAGTYSLRGRSRPTDVFEPLAAVVAEVEEEIREGRLSAN